MLAERHPTQHHQPSISSWTKSTQSFSNFSEHLSSMAGLPKYRKHWSESQRKTLVRSDHRSHGWSMLIHLTHLSHTHSYTFVRHRRHFPGKTEGGVTFIIGTDLLHPGDCLPTLWDPVDEGGGGGAGLVLLRLPHELPHSDHTRHLDASQQVCIHLFQCVNSSLLSDAGDIISQHLLRRDKNCNLEKNPVRNFTTSWRDGGRSSTEARRALLRPLLLLVRLEPAHHCKHTPGYYYSSARATRAFNSHLPDQRLFLKTKI